MFFTCREWRTGGHGGQGVGRGRTGRSGGSGGHDEGIGGARTWAVPGPAFSARFAEAVREKFFRSVLAKYTSEMKYFLDIPPPSRGIDVNILRSEQRPVKGEM
jgi:hypothetical protein